MSNSEIFGMLEGIKWQCDKCGTPYPETLIANSYCLVGNSVWTVFPEIFTGPNVFHFTTQWAAIRYPRTCGHLPDVFQIQVIFICCPSFISQGKYAPNMCLSSASLRHMLQMDSTQNQFGFMLTILLMYRRAASHIHAVILHQTGATLKDPTNIGIAQGGLIQVVSLWWSHCVTTMLLVIIYNAQDHQQQWESILVKILTSPPMTPTTLLSMLLVSGTDSWRWTETS